MTNGSDQSPVANTECCVARCAGCACKPCVCNDEMIITIYHSGRKEVIALIGEAIALGALRYGEDHNALHIDRVTVIGKLATINSASWRALVALAWRKQ